MYNLSKTLRAVRAAGWVVKSVSQSGTIFLRGNGTEMIGRVDLKQTLNGWYRASDVKLVADGVQP